MPYLSIWETEAITLLVGVRNEETVYNVARLSPPNACVSDRRQRESVSKVKASVEAASCSLDAMVRPSFRFWLPAHVQTGENATT